ncbi:LysR family transcriptional regulator [Paraglaciecola arctica]|uniref:LysR family transcriptional regulator n=1 Tax=Paraglaciecola arctica TaxID=1128911 RepID=UPI001C06A06E|nr:LysR family transcriptional regulator [Paraglaciecola arctica]MBU3002959.1 LysR family transcriptional regulator [Paraglaciecola arctica]
MNELECIRAFVKVVEVGSFAEAARQTGAVKSVISKRVNQLEDHLELQLIQRSTRRLTITDGGADFYERSVHLLAGLEEAKEAVSSVEWGLTGNFRVSCISSFTAAYLSNDLCEFQQEHPDLKVELQQHDRFCDPVQEGFDVCLQTSGREGGTLENMDILPLRRLIVATPEYIKNNGAPQRPEDLTAHRFAHNGHIAPDCLIRFHQGNRIVAIPIEPDVLTNTIWMIRAAVMRGQHMAMMPAFFIEKELLSGNLVPVLPNYRIQGAQLSAYYRRSSFVPMKVRIFINFLRQKYGDFPLWEQRILEKLPELSPTLGSTNNN